MPFQDSPDDRGFFRGGEENPDYPTRSRNVQERILPAWHEAIVWLYGESSYLWITVWDYVKEFIGRNALPRAQRTFIKRNFDVLQNDDRAEHVGFGRLPMGAVND